MKRLISLALLVSMINPAMTANDKKRALIFGVAGQDGSYLVEFLLDNGYEVHGVKRYHSSVTPCFADYLQKDLQKQGRKDLVLHWGDLTDYSNIFQLIKNTRPDEIYNLAAQSHVQVSFGLPEYTANCNALGTLRILEAIRQAGLAKVTRFYQASTSELFGAVCDQMQSEQSRFYPLSPYATAKLFAFWTTKNYREAYGMFACNGILFNHESERRPEAFVTRKITRSVARIACGLQDVLLIGNLDAKRDWGHALNYVEAMWLMLQHEKPDDYVIATGETHSVREFIELAFHETGITIVWQGKGIDEIGSDAATRRVLVKIDQQCFRPLDVQLLCGDASKATRILQWKPKITFNTLVKMMVSQDMKSLKAQVDSVPR